MIYNGGESIKRVIIGTCLLIALLSIGIVSGEFDKSYSDRSLGIKQLFQPIDVEARKYLIHERTSEELNKFAEHLVKKYSKQLDLIIDRLEDITGRTMTQKEREMFKYLLVREHLSKIDREQEFNNMSRRETVKPIPVGIYRSSGYIYRVYYAPLSTDVAYPIYYWIQVYPDVYGGKGLNDAGNSYNVNRNNSLYKVVAEYTTNIASIYVKYTLYFYDEDHPDPTWDAIYDV